MFLDRKFDATKLRPVFTIALSVVALASAGVGIFMATRSSMFIVRAIEVENQPELAPVDSDTISTLAAVPIGQENLFDLELEQIAERVRQHEWIKGVHVSKRFPQTVAISVDYRKPKAVSQSENEKARYVDESGELFGEVNAELGLDLPWISGIPSEAHSRPKMVEALRLIEAWSKSDMASYAQVVAVHWDQSRGFRVLCMAHSYSGNRIRSWVDFGSDPLVEGDLQLSRLERVFRHLIANELTPKVIRLDTGRRVLVKLDKTNH